MHCRTGRYLKCAFAFCQLNTDVNLRTLNNSTEFPGEQAVAVPTTKGLLQSLLHDYEDKHVKRMKIMWTAV
jgi:hypothetical protein